MKAHLGDNEGLDEHDHATRYDRSEGDDVEAPNDVENDVPWTGQVFC